MQRTLSRSLFVFALVAGAAFVALTANALPSLVATHFAASGLANGFMERPNYLAFMLIFITGFPALVVTSMSAVYRSSGERMNLPNGDWWLAPQRREATVAFLVAHAQWLGVLLVVFLCLVHRQLLQANTVQPPRLSGSMLIAMVGPFVLMMALWFAALMLRLRRPRI